MLFKNSLRVKQEETIVMDAFEYIQIICNTSTIPDLLAVVEALECCLKTL